MRLKFVYQPVSDLPAAEKFYREVLGWEEAWREDISTAYWLPNRSTQVMLSRTCIPTGPMFEVDDVGRWLADHTDVAIAVNMFNIVGGCAIGLYAPGDNVFYVFDHFYESASVADSCPMKKTD